MRFEVIGEDYTLGNLLQYYLLENICILEASYIKPHPLEDKIIIEVISKEENKEKEIISEVISKIILELSAIEKDFDEKIRVN